MLLFGGPPLLPLGLLGNWSPDGIDLAWPLVLLARIPLPGLAAMFVLPMAFLNLLFAASLGWRPAAFERLTLQLLDGQLGTLSFFCMLRVEAVPGLPQFDSRLLAFLTVLAFLPSLIILGALTLLLVLVPMLFAVVVTLATGTIPGWWLAYAPRLIRWLDFGAYATLTGRRPDYRLMLMPLEFAPKEERLPPGAEAVAVTDRSQLWRPRPRTPSA